MPQSLRSAILVRRMPTGLMACVELTLEPTHRQLDGLHRLADAVEVADSQLVEMEVRYPVDCVDWDRLVAIPDAAPVHAVPALPVPAPAQSYVWPPPPEDSDDDDDMDVPWDSESVLYGGQPPLSL